MQQDAGGADLFAGGDKSFEFRFGFVLGGGMGIGAGVEFDRVDAEFGAGRKLSGVGIEEQANLDAGVFEAAHGVGDALAAADDVEAAFGGDFFAALRDE